MTKEEVLERVKFHAELCGLSQNTQDEYYTKAKFFLNFFDKPATELGVEQIQYFLSYLKNANLEFFGNSSFLNNNDSFNDLISAAYSKEWVVYCKPPFKTAANVVEYLGRYTHRVAISNSRIIHAADGNVSFK